ncbi:hypothetical protein ACFYWN_29745 [Streptomyces sp. NPDC002917]|uniref:hypothetical protein n=1 Tax=Streptomyces sp. NPDC002917 TaxID=3364671 RepID=UPI0036ADC368
MIGSARALSRWLRGEIAVGRLVDARELALLQAAGGDVVGAGALDDAQRLSRLIGQLLDIGNLVSARADTVFKNHGRARVLATMTGGALVHELNTEVVLLLCVFGLAGAEHRVAEPSLSTCGARSIRRSGPGEPARLKGHPGHHRTARQRLAVRAAAHVGTVGVANDGESVLPARVAADATCGVGGRAHSFISSERAASWACHCVMPRHV